MIPPTQQKRSSISRIATVLVLVFLGFAVVCLSLGFLVQIPFYLLTGFVFFLARVLPQVHIRMEALAMFVCIASILAFGGHLFMRWLWSELWPTESSTSWKPRWTLCGVGLILITFCAGIAAVGIGHQTVWLANSPVRLLRFQGHERANRVKCASNLRTIGQGLKIYVADHGGLLPPDFSHLVRLADTSASVFICPSGMEDPLGGGSLEELAASVLKPEHCSYILLAAGHRDSALDGETILAYEPLENHDKEGANVLFADGHVDFLKAEDFKKLLANPKHRPPETLPTTAPLR